MENNNNFLLLIIAAIVIYYFLKDSFDCSNNVEGFKQGRGGRRRYRKSEDDCKAEQPIDGEGPYESCADMKTRVMEHRCKNTEVIDGEGPYESCADRKQTEKEWCQSNKIRPRRCQSTIRNELKCRGAEVIDEEGPYESCADMKTRVREHRCKNTEVIDDEQEGPYESCADKMQTEQEWCESNNITPKKCQRIIENELRCRKEGVIDGGPPYESCDDRNVRKRVANEKCIQEVPIDATIMNSNHPVYGFKSCEDRNARMRNFRDCIVEKAPSCLIRSGREN